MQVEQQQQVVMRKQEQATVAREALQQLKAAPQPTQQIAHLILQQNQPLFLTRVLQVTHTLLFMQRLPNDAQLYGLHTLHLGSCIGTMTPSVNITIRNHECDIAALQLQDVFCFSAG